MSDLVPLAAGHGWEKANTDYLAGLEMEAAAQREIGRRGKATARKRRTEARAAVRQVLRSARKRFHAALPTDRPPLDQPANVVGLFTGDDLTTLAQYGSWPLSAEQQAFIRQRPGKARRRARARFFRQLADLVTHEPEAVARLLASAMKGVSA